MRTYGKNYKIKARSAPYITEKERRERTATEWDIHIDVNDEITPATIRDNLLLDIHGLDYALVSGIEIPDVNGLVRASLQDHVHIALIFKDAVNRERALRACRPTKLTDEYAVPRNQKYTYAGWLAHHAKAGWKKNPTDGHIF